MKAIEVADNVGARPILVHAKDDDAKGFHRRYGFVESPVDPLTMMMPLSSVGRT